MSKKGAKTCPQTSNSIVSTYRKDLESIFGGGSRVYERYPTSQKRKHAFFCKFGNSCFTSFRVIKVQEGHKDLPPDLKLDPVDL